MFCSFTVAAPCAYTLPPSVAEVLKNAVMYTVTVALSSAYRTPPAPVSDAVPFAVQSTMTIVDDPPTCATPPCTRATESAITECVNVTFDLALARTEPPDPNARMLRSSESSTARRESSLRSAKPPSRAECDATTVVFDTVAVEEDDMLRTPPSLPALTPETEQSRTSRVDAPDVLANPPFQTAEDATSVQPTNFATARDQSSSMPPDTPVLALLTVEVSTDKAASSFAWQRPPPQSALVRINVDPTTVADDSRDREKTPPKPPVVTWDNLQPSRERVDVPCSVKPPPSSAAVTSVNVEFLNEPFAPPVSSEMPPKPPDRNPCALTLEPANSAVSCATTRAPSPSPDRVTNDRSSTSTRALLYRAKAPPCDRDVALNTPVDVMCSCASSPTYANPAVSPKES
eukprot:Opistho-2@166